VLGLLASAAFYFAYGWVGFAAIAGTITIGQMTMYIAQFRLGQNAVTSSLTAVNGMYEDNLYLSNLSEYLAHKVPEQTGSKTRGPDPADGIRFENVSFHYPGSENPALHNITLHIHSGESLAIVGENGSGKTTLIKLLTRLYVPTGGNIFLEGLELSAWDIDTLRQKIGVIFQDFSRYQLMVGENIGIGDVKNIHQDEYVAEAARKGMADVFVKDLPAAYKTQLGTWFKDGKELSGGQWQKIALSRAFMRSQADILILDEPTAALDPQTENALVDALQAASVRRLVIVIAHRLSTIRRADRIVFLEQGEIRAVGSHDALMVDPDNPYRRFVQLQQGGDAD
jgi:ATP-binding cassette subfamily B protein